MFHMPKILLSYTQSDSPGVCYSHALYIDTLCKACQLGCC